MKKAIKIIAIILVILLLFGVFMLIRKLSNNFTTDIKTFYLTMDGEMISSNKADLYILDKTIEVHSVNGKGFTCKIVRNTSAGSFTFYLDGEKHTFADEKDYTDGFDVEITDNSLVVKSTTMTEILNRKYGEGDIEFPELSNSTRYFTLEISSDGKSITLDFNVFISDDGELKITLDYTHLEF